MNQALVRQVVRYLRVVQDHHRQVVRVYQVFRQRVPALLVALPLLIRRVLVADLRNQVLVVRQVFHRRVVR